VSAYLLGEITPRLAAWFGESPARWEMQAWYSLVTSPPGELLPIQRLPHVDGTDPRQIAMMLDLHRTGHGGTAFFRHCSTGLEAVAASDCALCRCLARGFRAQRPSRGRHAACRARYPGAGRSAPDPLHHRAARAILGGQLCGHRLVERVSRTARVDLDPPHPVACHTKALRC
jgi:hypothetical protein